jgi:hypothetical protein
MIGRWFFRLWIQYGFLRFGFGIFGFQDVWMSGFQDVWISGFFKGFWTSGFQDFWMVRFFRMFGFSRVFKDAEFLILDLDIWFFRIGHRCLLVQRCKRVRGNEKIFD